MDIAICLAIGLLAGVCGGLFGIGGGIVVVPGLVCLLGFQQHRAQGTSLAALLAPIGILGAFAYAKTGAVDWKAATLIALGFIFGALGGARIAIGMDEVTMRRIFAGFLVVLAVQLLMKK